jgi:putative aldouronate transport system permease protein
MVKGKSSLYKIFSIVNIIFLGFLSFICLFPVLHVLAVSFSAPSAVAANKVGIIPVDFVTDGYREILLNKMFTGAFFVSTRRVIIGTSLNMLLITMTAYPLARDAGEFKGRNVFAWFFIIPMLFSGGLIPTYLLIRQLKLLNNFWVLIIPGAVPVFSVIMMMNFFRSLPKSLYEVAMIDGANHWYILFKIFIPLSMPSVATLTLFSMVGHWNSWFDGLIYMMDTTKWPLQTLLQSTIAAQKDITMLAELGDFEKVKHISDRTLLASKIVVATVPIICVYPFLQKYFIKGILVGSHN